MQEKVTECQENAQNNSSTTIFLKNSAGKGLKSVL